MRDDIKFNERAAILSEQLIEKLQTVSDHEIGLDIYNLGFIYEIDLELIKRDNSFHFCDNPLCFVCRCTWKYDFKYLPNYLIIKFISLFKKDKK